MIGAGVQCRERNGPVARSRWQVPRLQRLRNLQDDSLGRTRTEVRCAACGSHLGHVFEGEGYSTPTDLRYCMNSIAMTLEPKKQD